MISELFVYYDFSFKHVVNGTHVILREYEYISALSYNRISFLSNIWKALDVMKFKGLVVFKIIFRSYG